MGDREIERRIDELRRELDELAASVGRDGSTQAVTSTPRRTRRRLRRPFLLATVLAALAIPGVALASHQFSDVPDSNQFHTSISNVKIAGITAGCGGRKYCPDDPVTRGQMAAFLSRGLGRAAMSIDGAPEIGGTTYTQVVEQSIRTPGVGFVLATITGTVLTPDATACPCDVRLQITEDDGGSSIPLAETTVPAADAVGNVNASLSATYVFTAQRAGPHVFTGRMLANPGSFEAEATLTLLWVPFDGNGLAADLSG